MESFPLLWNGSKVMEWSLLWFKTIWKLANATTQLQQESQRRYKGVSKHIVVNRQGEVIDAVFTVDIDRRDVDACAGTRSWVFLSPYLKTCNASLHRSDLSEKEDTPVVNFLRYQTPTASKNDRTSNARTTTTDTLHGTKTITKPP